MRHIYGPVMIVGLPGWLTGSGDKHGRLPGPPLPKVPQSRPYDPLRGLQGPGHHPYNSVPPELQHARLALPSAREKLLGTGYPSERFTLREDEVGKWPGHLSSSWRNRLS